MKHIMIDLETLGTRPGCPVLSIGAVVFEPHMGELREEFYGVAHKNQSAYGLTQEQKTVDWWDKQSAEARKVFNDPNAVSLPAMLKTFANWLLSIAELKERAIWGNGASFDNAVLAAAYHTLELPLPWHYYNDRCYRTVKNLAPHVKLARAGEHHNALADAKSQAQHIMDIVQNTTLTLA